MSTLRQPLAPVVVAALVLAGLSSWQDTVFREQIEGKLTTSSQAALTEAGLGDADVRFIGRDATVEADTATAASTAGAVVRDVTGVRIVQAVGPAGEVDLDSAATGEPEDGDAGDEAAGDEAAGDEAAEASATEDDDADDTGSRSDDTETDGAETDGAEAGGTAAESAAAGDTAAGDTATSGSDDADAEPTTKEKAEAQDDLVEIPNITFVTDSAQLTRDGRRVVRRAAEVLEEHPDVRVRIEGHTDSRGDADDNLKLSKQRAITVLDRLVDLGVDEDRLSFRGFGETDPLVEPRTFADLEKNRRVEFIVRD
ncbi:OmpA family protein [Myceligenerans xiligouense]|uniref:Outer membrane protein OmpA-like peptidoglycan-associated protein n=1 Tax=Myceligenerans xiligouense TaxID=253184 RepID=A0A3N4Z5T2_9MICO|nr:OmpA family protein [Myceligenerans xiligouense]RPF20602.1 outer membrane protein OmpA-like peptidoglycan-associated protein [Myceligenerans xiligouense]